MKKALLATFTLLVLGMGAYSITKHNEIAQKQQEISVKHEDREILGKTDDGEFLQLVLWDSAKQKEHKIRVNPDEYDDYSEGEVFFTSKDTKQVSDN